MFEVILVARSRRSCLVKACATVAQRLRTSGSHLISRVRRSAVAYIPAVSPRGPRKRGRPRVYDRKLKLWSLFDSPVHEWQPADSPVYGERDVTMRFLCRDLIWRPLRTTARFVLVDHPQRGHSIFITTDLSAMPKITRRCGTQHLHRATELYRAAVRRKLGAYQRHIQIGLIAQGLLECPAIQHLRLVWSSFGSWLRTIRPGVAPSELVTAAALRNSLPDFLAQQRETSIFKKFICERIEPANCSPFRLTG